MAPTPRGGGRSDALQVSGGAVGAGVDFAVSGDRQRSTHGQQFDAAHLVYRRGAGSEFSGNRILLTQAQMTAIREREPELELIGAALDAVQRGYGSLLFFEGPLGLFCLGSAALAGPMVLLESGQVLGIAFYLGLTSAPAGSGNRGRATGTNSGARALGLGLGLTLVVVAFTEKLGSPGVFAALLDGYGALDLLSALGVSEATFIRLAGTTEVILGLLLVTGAAPELVALTAAVPFWSPCRCSG